MYNRFHPSHSNDPRLGLALRIIEDSFRLSTLYSVTLLDKGTGTDGQEEHSRTRGDRFMHARQRAAARGERSRRRAHGRGGGGSLKMVIVSI